MTVSVDVLLADTGAIARRLAGFEVRPQQLAMAAAVERPMPGSSASRVL